MLEKGILNRQLQEQVFAQHLIVLKKSEMRSSRKWFYSLLSKKWEASSPIRMLLLPSCCSPSSTLLGVLVSHKAAGFTNDSIMVRISLGRALRRVWIFSRKLQEHRPQQSMSIQEKECIQLVCWGPQKLQNAFCFFFSI